MRIVIFIMLVLLCILLLIAYSLCVIAHDSDERAERMYKKWKESINERSDSKAE